MFERDIHPFIRKCDSHSGHTMCVVLMCDCPSLIFFFFCMQRGLYYCLIRYFEDQITLNQIILCISKILSTPRHKFGVAACPRGLVYGDVILKSATKKLFVFVSNFLAISFRVDVSVLMNLLFLSIKTQG